MAAGSANPFERIPPHDAASEAGVLGAMLIDERAAGVAVELLVTGDFYVPRHQILYKLFSDLYQQTPHLDMLYIKSELDRRGMTAQVGGKEVVDQLVVDTPTAANVELYCRVVRDRAVERELLNGAAQIVRMIQEPGADEGGGALMERAEQLIFQVAEKRTSNETVSIQSVLETIVEEAGRVMEARRQGLEIPSPAVATGFHDMDKMFSGGLWPGEVIVIAARPSVGKTTFAINIARKVSCKPPEKKPVPVAIFSLEMPKEQVSKNLLCAQAGIASDKMRRYAFDEQDFEIVRDAARSLQTAPLFIDDSPGLTVGELRARARRLYHRDGVRLFLIDYLQLMQAGSRHDNREQAVAELSRQVKLIARELGVPIVLLSQLRRPLQGHENEPPKLTDLRESGAIEQDADVVIMLHRELDSATNTYSNNIRVIVQKNRNGELGEVKLNYFPHKFQFEPFYPEVGEPVSASGD